MPQRLTPSANLLARWVRLSAEMAGCVGAACYKAGATEAMLHNLEAAAVRCDRGDCPSWPALRRQMRATLNVLLDELEG